MNFNWSEEDPRK